MRASSDGSITAPPVGATATDEKELSVQQPSRQQTIAIMLVACSANFLTIYASGAVTIALPTIAAEFDIEESQLQWVISAYALTFAGFLLILGRLADIYGQKKIFILGMIWFAVWSIVCGFMHNIIGLDIARALQGMGAAASGPSAAGMLGKYFHGRPIARNRAFSVFGATNPIGFVAGMFIGGIFTQTIGWRWVFHLCGIVSMLVVLLAVFGIARDEIHPDIDRRVDWIGAILGTAGIVLLTYAVSAGNTDGWGSPQIIVSFILSVLLLVGFIVYEHRCPYALLPLNLFKRPGFAAIVVVLFSVQWTFGGTYLFHLTLAFQKVYDMNPIVTALHLSPLTIMGAIAALFSAYMILNFQRPKLAISGCMLMMAVATGLFAFVHVDTSYWRVIFPSELLVIIGYELVYNYANILVQTSVGPHQQSLASGVFTTTAQIANGIGLAVETTVSSAVNNSQAPNGGPDLLMGYRVAMLVAGGLQFAGVIFSAIFIPRDMPEEEGSDSIGGLVGSSSALVVAPTEPAMEVPASAPRLSGRRSSEKVAEEGGVVLNVIKPGV
ncbi:major facilitator superfamily domain-containing protein [Geranomyces variabilis]|nr:major facilitator superfamily domain-containing protein [Geranomyces variabilis]KAJ3142203.1 hypothetical protein HDU90_004476 [Geranomyces variabilis]